MKITFDDRLTTWTFYPLMLNILFIGLKLANVINWSWMWVFAPIWVPFVPFVIVGAIGSTIIFIKNKR